jgi:hypothetical protein
MNETLPASRRNYASGSNDTYGTIPNDLTKLNAERHDGFSAWKKSILNAKIIQLGPSDEWKEDENSIQVKEMGYDDLKCEAMFPCPYAENEYEACLYVIKLPMSIPLKNGGPALNFFFLRPDDVRLFDCVRRTNWCILLGNRGISKSWFQWKYILLCYRLDLFRLLKPKLENLEYEKVPTFPKDDTLEALRDRWNIFPNLIVRTVADKKSLFFYIDPSIDVFYAEHSTGALRSCTDKRSMILWEPDKDNAPFEYHWCKSRIIATVSPHEKQYPEFQKKAITFYMPCPSEFHIRMMGQIFRSISNEFEDCPNSKELQERIKKYGLCIQSSFFWSDAQRKEFLDERDLEIERIYASERKLFELIAIPSYFDSPKAFSHIFRYDVARNGADKFGGYVLPRYVFASENLDEILEDEIMKLDSEGTAKAMRIVMGKTKFS